MRKAIVLILLLTGCAAVKVPPEFVYREIQTRDFTLATWQKITDPDGVYKIYIEGDGHAFNARGRATNDPTPRGTLVRELAFGDPSPNVVYLSRPCQYVKSEICSKRHWTTARFAPEIINAEYDAVRQIAGNSPIILIGFSGGAQAAGLIAAAKPGLNVEEIITVAGNLDHLAWTQYQKVPPLNESLNLESYRKQFAEIPQTHYVGSNDKVIPPFLVKEFVGSGKRVIEVPNATHNSGWEPYSYYPQGKRAVEPFVRILTEPLGLSQKIYHHPTGRQFFNEVEGFVINDKLTVLRYYGYGVYPGICKQLAVIFGGRLPTGDEMREIARNVDRICVSLAAVGEGPLYRGPYLITDDPGPYGALTMDIEAPDKIEPVDFDEGCSFIVVK